MKRLGRWLVWILILEFLLFFAIGLRMRREMQQQRVYFVQEATEALGRPA